MTDREIKRNRARRRAQARAEAERYSTRVSETSTHSREEMLRNSAEGRSSSSGSGRVAQSRLNHRKKTNKFRRRRRRRRRNSLLNQIKEYFWYRRFRLPIVAAILVVIIIVFQLAKPSKDETHTTESDHDYRVVNQTVKLNNEWYNGRAMIQDKQTKEIYIPAKELKEGLGGNVSLKNADVIEHEDIKYVAMSTLHKKIGVNVRMTDDNIYYIDNFPDLDYSWVNENRMIAHSMGGLDGKTYLNCMEGFQNAYDKGFRIFEADIAITTDGVPVCLHGWKSFRQKAKNFRVNDEPFDYKNFKAARLYGKYHPLSLEDVVDQMRQHKDFYLILDTKVTEKDDAEKVYSTIIKTVNEIDPKILDRFIPQIYNDSLINVAFDAYDWKSAIYTLYKQDEMTSNLSTFENAYSAGIRVFVMNKGDYDATLVQQVYDIDGSVYMHSFNEMDEIDPILKKTDVYGFYTDFLAPDAINEYKFPPDLDN